MSLFMSKSDKNKVRVRILTSIAGLALPHYNIPGDFGYQPGQIVSMHPELAEAWIDSGIVERVADADDLARGLRNC
jgi:hypothetical protein